MTVVRRTLLPALAVALLLTARSFTGAARGADDPPAREDADKPLATAKHDKGLVVEVLEVRPDKNKPLLTIRWRYRNPTKKPIEVLAQSGPFLQLGGRPIDHFIRDTYFLNADEDTTYRHSIVRDTGRKLWATPRIGLQRVVVKPRDAVEFWAKFSMPGSTTQTISLHLPDVPPIDDLAVQKRSEK
jgi:hypothetical protein